MKICFPFAASLLLAACISTPSEPLGPQRQVIPGASAVFMHFPPGEKPPFKSKAAAGGVLTQRGQCLGIVGSDGRFATLYWPATARVEADSHGLVLVDTVGGGRVRLGDYMVFAGGSVPRTVRFPFGETPLECARWPGYDGWLAIVNSGFRAENAPRTPVGHLPIAREFYVARPYRCDEADSLFRYDGAGMAWLSRGRTYPAALYPIRAVREERGRWVATISSPGPGVHREAEQRDVKVIVTPDLNGLVTVETFGREEMRLCSADELPQWAKGHPSQ
jgi:hypothetical protein